MSSEPTRVLVLGMDGMLGHEVFARLSADRALDVRGTRRPGLPGGTSLDAEAGVDALREALRVGGRPGFVVNAIGLRADRIKEADPDSEGEAERVNAAFPQALAGLAEEMGFRVIHASTDGVFARAAGRCFEDTPAQPPDVYGRTKLRGEADSSRVLNVRCSLVGPDPERGRGLFEWLKRQPAGARVTGFTDQLWNGVTTAQLADLCRALLAAAPRFDEARAEGPVHHFCPNRTVTKHELLVLFRDALGLDVEVVAGVSDAPSNRELGTRLRSLPALMGADRPMEEAVRDMSRTRRHVS